jgi:hypothetical protein
LSQNKRLVLLKPGKTVNSLNRPERKGFPGLQARIPVVKKIELAIVTRPGERNPFSESQGAEGTGVGLEFDLNEYAVLAALLSDRKDFCRDRSHSCHFPGLTSPETLSAFNLQGAKRNPKRSENSPNWRISPSKSSSFCNAEK